MKPNATQDPLNIIKRRSKTAFNLNSRRSSELNWEKLKTKFQPDINPENIGSLFENNYESENSIINEELKSYTKFSDESHAKLNKNNNEFAELDKEFEEKELKKAKLLENFMLSRNITGKNQSSQNIQLRNIKLYGKIKILPLNFNFRASSLYFSDKKCFSTIFGTEKKSKKEYVESPLRSSEQIFQMSNVNINPPLFMFFFLPLLKV